MGSLIPSATRHGANLDSWWSPGVWLFLQTIYFTIIVMEWAIVCPETGGMPAVSVAHSSWRFSRKESFLPNEKVFSFNQWKLRGEHFPSFSPCLDHTWLDFWTSRTESSNYPFLLQIILFVLDDTKTLETDSYISYNSRSTSCLSEE